MSELEKVAGGFIDSLLTFVTIMLLLAVLIAPSASSTPVSPTVFSGDVK